MNYTTAITDMQNAYNALAPSEKSKDAVRLMRREMQGLETDHTIALAMATALFDGLAYGNWRE